MTVVEARSLSEVCIRIIKLTCSCSSVSDKIAMRSVKGKISYQIIFVYEIFVITALAVSRCRNSEMLSVKGLGDVNGAFSRYNPFKYTRGYTRTPAFGIFVSECVGDYRRYLLSRLRLSHPLPPFYL